MSASCLACDWQCDEPDPDTAGCLASWHVFEKHPALWRQVIGSRPPLDRDPRGVTR